MKTLKLLITILLTVTLVKANAQSIFTVDKMITSYIDVKNALVADDTKLTAYKANVLLEVLSDKTDQALTAGQQEVFKAYAEKLKFDSRHMGETAVLDHQREHFASLSKNMYMLLKDLKANTSTVYVQYCPMKKSFWLSETENIRNPYYGKEMMTCGSNKAVLKPAGK